MSLKHIKLTLLSKLNSLHIRRSIKVEFLVVLILTSLMPTVAINLFYLNRSSNYTQEKIGIYNTEIIRQVRERLGSLVRQINSSQEQIIALLVASETHQGLFETISKESINQISQMDEYFRGIKRCSPYISDIYYIKPNNIIITSNRQTDKNLLIRKQWVKDFKNLELSNTIISPHIADYAIIIEQDKVNCPFTFSFLRKLNILNNPGELGILQIDIKYSEIKSIIESVLIGDDGFILVADESGNIIYCPDSNYLGMNLNDVGYRGINYKTIDSFIKGEDAKSDFLITSFILEDVGWNVVGGVNKKNVAEEFGSIKRESIMMLFASFLVLLFTSYMLSIGITRPISNVINSMAKVGEGDFGVSLSLPRNYNEDLKLLVKSFNSMINRIDVLIKNVIEKEMENKYAQLKALQSQINPHFLYNTLETVRSIALGRKIKSIAKISYNLAEIFRYSINRDMEQTTIRDEIKYTKYYIEIQKFRYGQKFNMVYNIDESIYDCKIIRLVIQPLIENAFYHGIETKMTNGKIELNGSRKGSNIIIEVIDNGIGIEKDKVEQINRSFIGTTSYLQKNKYSNTGIGIVNVNSRLKLTYGNNYGLTIRSKKGYGTKVQINIPLIE